MFAPVSLALEQGGYDLEARCVSLTIPLNQVAFAPDEDLGPLDIDLAIVYNRPAAIAT